MILRQVVPSTELEQGYKIELIVLLGSLLFTCYLIRMGLRFFVQYYGNPIRFNWRNWEHESEREWPVDEDTDTNKYYTEVALPDIVKFDYLLVAETEKDFEKKYCNKLKICPLEVGNIYKVILNDDGSFNRFDYVDNIYNRRGNK